jgi:hypothetical protein
MLNKLQQRVKQLADSAQTSAVDLLTEKVPVEVREERWKICQGCEKLYVPTSTCRLCGCFMQVKTWMPNQKCPASKWEKYTPNN